MFDANVNFVLSACRFLIQFYFLFLNDKFSEMQNQLACQKSNLREYIEKIQGLEEELKKTEDLFSKTKRELEKTTDNLKWARQEVDETKELVNKHMEGEENLYGQATDLLNTVEETVAHTRGLHSSLNRNKSLHQYNTEKSQEFKQKARTMLDEMKEELCKLALAEKGYNENIVADLGKYCFLRMILKRFTFAYITTKLLK